MRALAQLRRDEKGATVIEFAIVAPVLAMTVLGLADLSHKTYMINVLQGQVQQAARDATLESSNDSAALAAIDQKVKDALRKINGQLDDSKFTITRRNFASFSDAGKMEPTTGPGGVCAAGFTYVDRNNSGTWDDGASGGQGDANDVTLYTIRVDYNPLLPINKMWGGAAIHRIEASTVLRNQPWKDQQARNPGITRNCT